MTTNKKDVKKLRQVLAAFVPEDELEEATALISQYQELKAGGAVSGNGSDAVGERRQPDWARLGDQGKVDIVKLLGDGAVDKLYLTSDAPSSSIMDMLEMMVLDELASMKSNGSAFASMLVSFLKLMVIRDRRRAKELIQLYEVAGHDVKLEDMLLGRGGLQL